MILPAGARRIQIHFTTTENVTLALKERQTNVIIHDGFKSWNKTTFITEGSKFNYERVENVDETLEARGPLLGPLVILTVSDRIGAKFRANVSFTMSRYNDPLFSMQKYEWVMKGWSRCSKECGGGSQHLILR